MASDGTLIEN